MNREQTGQCKLNGQADGWELILTRVLEHPCEDVWEALTRAEEVAKWGPFTPSSDLMVLGSVQLMHMNNPQEDIKEGYVHEVVPPHLLVFQWGADMLRWELQAVSGITILTLRHCFTDRRMAPSYAAGWHLCLQGLSGTLDGIAMPSMVGSQAVNYGYKELYKQYEAEFDKT